MMKYKTEQQKAENYFKNHPDPKIVKYDRKDSGLSASYYRSPNGKITRMFSAGDSPNYVAGQGGFGRVKLSHSDGQDTVTHIRSMEWPEFIESERRDLEKEAACNLDFGIAKGPLIQNLQPKKNRIKYYQEMYKMKCTLREHISNMNAEQRIAAAIDVLLLVDACHSGLITKTGKAYIHGDISFDNIMLDQNEHLRLIDFMSTKELRYTDQLEKDSKFVLQTIFENKKFPMIPKDAIYDESVFPALPSHIQDRLLWEKNKENMQSEDFLTLTAAVLIAYAENNQLSPTDIVLLKEDTYQQVVLIEGYKRKKEIFTLPDPIAQALLKNTLRLLERYCNFLNKKCADTKNDPQ